MIERLWVEINGRVNYPVKTVLLRMENDDAELDMSDSMTKFCVSWFCTEVLTVGIRRFISSWNNHPIPGM